MKLLIDVITLTRTSKIRVRKLDREDKLLGEYVGHYLEPKDYDRTAKQLGVSEDILRDCITEYRKAPDKLYTFELQTRPAKPIFSVRGEVSLRNTGKAFGEFKTALQSAKPDEVVEWQGTSWVCNLDIDFPNDAPTVESVNRFIETLTPRPGMWWVSRSGVGVHLIYTTEGIFDADELAAIAAYNITRRFPNCRAEFLSRTRGIPVGVVPTVQQQTADVGVLRGLLTTFTDTDVEGYLDGKGWVVGQRLAHTECPVNPSDKAKGNSPPVVIHADCVYCYVCNANGIRSGSVTPGRFPYAALSGKRVNTQLAVCIENLVHWGHAKHVVTSKVQNGNLARKVYSALLKLRYGDDARIVEVFKAGEPNGLVRYQGHWADNRGSTVVLRATSSIVASLPHCQIVGSNGSIGKNAVACEWLSQTVDHSCRGFFPVVPLYGVQLSQFQELPEDKIYSVQNSAVLAPTQYERKRPKYIPSADRIDIEAAWKVLEVVYPGLNRGLIQCLIAARGCIEHRTGLPPMLFLTGPTGVGKTSHIDIASAILGDSVHRVYLNRDRDRFNNELITSKKFAGFINLDEVFKFGNQAGMKPVESAESILSFSETSNVYLIHVGAIQFGHLPVFVFTDSTIPTEVMQHEQIGRRVFLFPLHSEVHWEKTLADSGIGESKYLRSNGNEELVSALDAILSSVVDDFFLTPATDFADVCEALGVKRLRDSGGVEDMTALIVDLFNAVKAGKPVGPEDRKRWSKPGFIVCTMTDTDKVYRAFVELQSEKEKGGIECAVLAESDLQRKLGLLVPTKFEIKRHGAKLAMRFVAVEE